MELARILYVDDEVINLELLQLTFMNDFEALKRSRISLSLLNL